MNFISIATRGWITGRIWSVEYSCPKCDHYGNALKFEVIGGEKFKQ